MSQQPIPNVFFEGPVLWAQVDANAHLRHSAYADFAAQARMQLLENVGLSLATLNRLKLGPILFREELRYLKEIRPNDQVRVTVELTKCRPDASRWSFRQDIYRSDGVLAAQVTLDGAWIDMEKRKLGTLPSELTESFLEKIPKGEDFILEQPSSP